MVLALAHLAEAVQHVRQHLTQGHHVLGALAPADGVHLLLGGLQDVAGLAQALLHHGGDLRRRLGHAPEQSLVPDDGHILHDVGAGGRDLHQLGKVRAGGLVVVGTCLLHLLADGDAVDGPGVGEHGIDGLEDLPVLPQVEVRRPQLIHHVLHAVGIDQHGAEDGLLTFQAVGHLAEQQVFHCHKGSPPCLVWECPPGWGTGDHEPPISFSTAPKRKWAVHSPKEKALMAVQLDTYMSS